MKISLSDAEFVEKARKQLACAKFIAYKCLALSVLWLVFVPAMFYFAKREHFSDSGYVGGCGAGILAGMCLMTAILYFSFFILHLFGNRTEKLLVTYYDQVHSPNK